MFWTIWFWLGLLSGWCVTVGHYLGTPISAIVFTLIVFFVAPASPLLTDFILMVLYAVGICVVAIDFPSFALPIYLSFLIPFIVVMLGKAPGYQPVKLFNHSRKKNKGENDQKDKVHSTQEAPLDPKAKEIIGCVHFYRDQFLKSHNQPAEIKSTNKVISLCDLFVKSMSKDELDDFIRDSEGTVESSACCAIVLVTASEVKRYKNADGKIHIEELPLELLAHINTLYAITNFVLENRCSLGWKSNLVEDDDQKSQDDFWDGFEDVDLSTEEEPAPPKKKEKHPWQTLLLILCVILLAVSALMLRVEYETGLKEGYSEGYAAGEHDGYSTGSDDGYKKGYSIGYDDGRAAVDLNVAYESGYEDGYSDAINGY